MTPYEELATTLREIALLGSSASLLHWDEQTKMPPKGGQLRADQVSYLARLCHERFTSPRIGELLAALEESGDLQADADSDAAVNVRETRRSYDRAVKLPARLVEELSRTTVLGQQAWADARRKSHFASFQPWLGKIVDLKREEAQALMSNGGPGSRSGNPYDALLDEYERGETAESIRTLFAGLRQPLVELVERVKSSSRRPPVDLLKRHFPAPAQEILAREASAAVGFDYEAGRLDTSVHPFCSGIGPGDTRMTTRYDEHFFPDAFFGTLHETGHGLYDQGLPGDHFGTPLSEAVSLGIHESQSRLWENLVGRSRAFWKWFLPRTREVFPQAMEGVTEEAWVAAINSVQPSLIRVEADEVTYNLHILLRFELEEAMLRGELLPADLPGAWNERMEKYLGITPPDDARGCLQDIHWSGGGIGYFPTYTLGNLYSAQLFEGARRDLGNLDEQIARGEFAPLLGWLREHIHRHGKRYAPRELVRRATGSEPTSEPLLRHLRAKVEAVYG